MFSISRNGATGAFSRFDHVTAISQVTDRKGLEMKTYSHQWW